MRVMEVLIVCSLGIDCRVRRGESDVSSSKSLFHVSFYASVLNVHRAPPPGTIKAIWQQFRAHNATIHIKSFCAQICTCAYSKCAHTHFRALIFSLPCSHLLVHPNLSVVGGGFLSTNVQPPPPAILKKQGWVWKGGSQEGSCGWGNTLHLRSA